MLKKPRRPDWFGETRSRLDEVTVLRRLALVSALLATAACGEGGPPTEPGIEPAFAKPPKPPADTLWMSGAFVADGQAVDLNAQGNPVLGVNTFVPNNEVRFQNHVTMAFSNTLPDLDSNSCVFSRGAKEAEIFADLQAALADGDTQRDRFIQVRVHVANLGVPSDSNRVGINWIRDDGREYWFRVSDTDAASLGVSPPTCSALAMDEWECHGGTVNIWHRASGNKSIGSVSCVADPADTWTVRVLRISP